MNYIKSSTDAKRLSELLDTACSLIITLEGYIVDANSDYDETPCAKEVHKLFDEIDMLNFHPHEDTGPEHDSAGFTEEDRIVDGQYMVTFQDTDLAQLERASPYEKYVTTVTDNIHRATKIGILTDDDSEGYSYLSKESFDHRCRTDLEFAAQWGDPNCDPDQVAQDYNTFGKNKI
jgi:hypothetical protein